MRDATSQDLKVENEGRCLGITIASVKRQSSLEAH
ncbi:hypothetical protein BofuT4_uP079230.1 [Botrytis cinerea T4]|uniref:Uncharacterized protein n=1 Tax=Botryotinia fuckeliana (strain T4) TaxID=999810 RepID=G2YKI0_BOTF4|nr:hypothetical protein BofuT4_uP079230.1 [Botrytis cinerea T4]